MDYKENIDKWIKICPEDISEINAMSEKEKERAFSSELVFGTAGIRAIMSPGISRLNKLTIRKITLAIAKYMENHKMSRVCICYDGRNNSSEFAQEAADIFLKNEYEVFMGIIAFPTPFLSYSVRNYNADIGVMITASHNAKDYNGYKMFNSEGCQISEEVALEIQSLMSEIDIFEEDTTEDTIRKMLISETPNFIHERVFVKYINDCIKILDNNSEKAKIKVLYTPLNGVGTLSVFSVLGMLDDFVSYNIVQSQIKLDGNFPTCPKPNPELPECWEEAFDAATDEDIIIATDPDADRMGVAVKDENGYRILTGNEESVLLFNYLCERESPEHLPEKYVVRTYVTTSMIDRIAKKYKVRVKLANTGFKNICSDFDDKAFLMGTEEAIGNLVTTHVRDKDAQSAIVLLCEMTAVYKAQGITLLEKLEEIYKKYGIVKNKQLVYENVNLEDIKAKLFSKDGVKIKNIIHREKIDEYTLENNIKLIIRASGTEPKIKVFIEGYDDNFIQGCRDIEALLQ